MLEELEYEFSEFRREIKSGSLVFGQYFDEDEYEDEYSHNEIDEYKEKFISKVKEYLHENNSGQYVVTGGWCVFVMTVAEAEKRKMSKLDLWIVN